MRYLIALLIALGLLAANGGPADGESAPVVAEPELPRRVDVSATRVKYSPPAFPDRLARAASAIKRLERDARSRRSVPVAELAAWCVDALDEVLGDTRLDLAPERCVGLLWVESRFDVAAVSHRGACGIAQVMPRRFYDDRPTCGELIDDPEYSVRWGMEHLADRWAQPWRYNGAGERARDWWRDVERAAWGMP